MTDLPASILNAVHQEMPDIVDAGKPLDSTDVASDGVHLIRFAFAWQSNARWIVVTDHGGPAFYDRIYTVVLSPFRASSTAFDHRPGLTVSTIISRPLQLCEDADRALKDKLPPLPS